MTEHGPIGKSHRILFASPAFYGHVAPSLAIVRHLKQRGHTVGYCSGSSAKALVMREGVDDFYPRDACQSGMERLMLEKMPFYWFFDWWRNASKVITRQFLEESYRELIMAFDAFRPDVVYVDTGDPFAMAVAERYRIPYAHGSATCLLYYEKGIPPLGSGWNIKRRRLNAIRTIPYLALPALYMLKMFLTQKRALRSIDPDWKMTNYSGISPYLFMLFSTDKLEYPRELFIPQMFYVGPSIYEADESAISGFPWHSIDDRRPLIYVASGATFFDRYKVFYHMVIEALSEKSFVPSVQVVMAIGKGQSPEQFGNIPSNFIIVPFAPQIKVLQKAAIFITHGGVNSVNEGLLHGKPLIVVNLKGGDRIEMAQRIEYNGAGIRLDLVRASVPRIREAVSMILKQPRFTRAAEGMMSSYQTCKGADTAAGLIELLAATQQPILRKKGAPITLPDINNLPDYL
jgi:zeaxanthin glucosyltransferase